MTRKWIAGPVRPGAVGVAAVSVAASPAPAALSRAAAGVALPAVKAVLAAREVLGGLADNWRWAW
ncbi:MAG: hypothetical protein ACREB3_12590 [Burkholderiales bacterium]